jgi:serpin B
MRTKGGPAAVAVVLISSALACGCAASSRQPPGKPSRPPVVLTSSQVNALRAYGTGDSVFGLSLLSALCHDQPGTNVVISPVSLATGLGMAYLGARGATATTMARVLHLPTTGQSLAAGLAARAALLGSLNRRGVAFSTSDRIWADPTLVTNRGFVAALRAGYQAGLTHVPLLTMPEQARAKINAAVAADTRGHITDLLPPGSIPPNAIGWLLTDALYLNANWKHPFNHAMTQPGSFSTARGKVTVQYMSGVSLAVTKASGWTAVSLPYRGNRLSMLALLPRTAGQGAAGGCQLPTTGAVSTLVAGLAATHIQTEIALPKVKLASSYPLQGVLTSLGMGIAFGGRADFSGLSPQACCIGFVRHAATLAVAEKGTVASAATAVGIMPSAGHLVLSFDRPYMLMLRDSLTGEPLMLAWVANPASS